MGYSIVGLCKLVGVSKQAYYQYDGNEALEKAAREEFALKYIKAIRKEDPGIGGTKLWYMYKKEFGCEQTIGRDRFCRIIDDNNLKVRNVIRKPRTTDSTHGLPTYPNLVKDFIGTAANQLWVSDITYIMIVNDDYHYHFCYLSLVLDYFSEEIIGWSVGPTLDKIYPIEALKMALKRIKGKEIERLIHHSDRGCQYACREYVKLLKDNGIEISMTETGDPKDNAKAERINNTMKNELLKGKIFRSIKEVIDAVAYAVHFYNYKRIHMSTGMRTPIEASGLTGDLGMTWDSRRIEAIKNRDKLDNPENCLSLQNCQGSPSACGLQSTPYSDKTRKVNPSKG